MISGRTQSGFEFTLTEDVLDDYELFEALREIDKGNTSCVVDVIKMLLGEQENALKEHLRNENGKVTISGMVAELTEILNSSSKPKN